MTQQGILSGNEILRQVEKGSIKIDPFNPEHINPVSYDLTLGRGVAVYRGLVHGDFGYDPLDPYTGISGVAGGYLTPADGCLPVNRVHREPGHQKPPRGLLDAAEENEVLEYSMKDGEPFMLKPGIGYLMHTEEQIWSDTYEPILDGKSSIGRLFVKVHETAGFGDPHFDGQYTLEVTAVHPVLIWPGMRICQIRFETIVGEVTPYGQHKSNYTGVFARGPVPSRSWKMFPKARK